MTDVEISKQANWGSARDNEILLLVVRRSMADADAQLITEGRITAGATRTPMYVCWRSWIPR